MLLAAVGAACSGPGEPARVDRPADAEPIGMPIAVPAAADLDFAPIADARVDESARTSNFGAALDLGADASPLMHGYLKFAVTGLDRPVARAALRLWVTGGSADGPAVYAAASAGWSESALTWNNQPGVTGRAVADAGRVPAGSWIELDVTPLVVGNGAVSLVLVGTSTDGFDASSREAAANRPQLAITLAELPAVAAAAAVIADARVDQSAPAGNFGAAASVAADLDPSLASYLRFTVGDVEGPVLSAKLRLWVSNGTVNAPALYRTTGAWSEAGLTWANRPATLGDPIADVAMASGGAWVDYDVTRMVIGPGTYDVALIPQSSDGFAAAAREGTAPPQVVVTTTAPVCADGFCGASETCSSCAADCGPCSAPLAAAVIADARVEMASPAVSFGAAAVLASDRDPQMRSYLRVAVSGVDGPVISARLRLYVTNATADAPALHVAGAGWTESSITWTTQPTYGPVPIADLGAAAAGTWVEYDLTALLVRDGTYDLALVAQSSDGFAVDAREGAHPPQIALAVGAVLCGDGACAGGEGCAACPLDCGACPSDESFTFAFAGDHGSTSNTSAVLALIPASGELFLSLGDLSYGEPAPERAWCDWVKSYIGPTYPFAIVAGNHEDYDQGDGLIDNFIAADCLPNRLAGVTGTYGKQYWFDYPAGAPLARFIMISPSLDFSTGGAFHYRAGEADYLWTAAAIDDARARGIPWLVVGMHSNCMSMGVKSCEIGADIVNLLVARRVDLIVQGHDHTYQRTMQLAHGAGCPGLAAGSFNPACIADSGADGVYRKGAGPVLVINGTGGRGLYEMSTADPEAGYFAAYSIGNTHGLNKVTVWANRMDVEFVHAAGTSYSDAFSIVR